eukprot:CAMPEP_0197738712 /NCGR_PEP_ID=MMETSP1435-20131217/16060_1 /TAXON_ID=426625 /ORGANISM="Chaetoceros brevis, Strain CCMP164" /LENGTH=77 /DNA_ID=CAMNT_0043327723 /DNA_START=15 /DNA_END=248 /DNA_ORIENTATION=-
MPSEENSKGSWRLPDGIEDHIESGLIKGAVGAVAGGVLGAIFFKSGKGWRSASAAFGIGTAIGSTAERAYRETPQSS